MNDPKVGQQFTVKTRTSKGLNLREEPKRNASIILLMPKGSKVTLVGDEVRTSGGREWYNVKYKLKESEKTGWVVSDYLEPVEPPPQLALPAKDVTYNGDLQYSVANLPQLPNDVALGAVKYSIGNETHQTSVDEWNTASTNSLGINYYPIPK